MTRRGRATAELTLATEPRPLVVAAGATVLLVCLSGTADLDATATLTRYDAALLTAPATHTLHPTGTTAVLTLRAVEG